MPLLLQTNLRRLKKMTQTHPEHADQFLKGCKAGFIDFLSHSLHTFKKHVPEEYKKHVSHILRAKTARIAKARMLEAHHVTGGGIFDFFKRVGSSVLDMTKRAGSSVASTASSFYDKAVPMAQKGLDLAKPYIKEYGPYIAGKAAEMIPVIGPVAGPIVKKGAAWALDKLWK